MTKANALLLGLLLVTAPLLGGERPTEANAPEPAEAKAGGRAWIGVWLGDAVDGGVQVLAVVPGGPAESAGVRAGDVILAVDDRAAPGQSDLGSLLARRAPGDEVTLELLREGKTVQAELHAGHWNDRPTDGMFGAPPAPEPPPTIASRLRWRLGGALGIGAAEMTPELRRHFGAPVDAGVLVTGVADDSVAASAGLEVGDVVVDVGGEPVRAPRDIEDGTIRWSDDGTMRVRVIRDGSSRELSLAVKRTAHAAPGAVPKEAIRRSLRLEIERLQRRIEELQRTIDELGDD